MNLNGRRIDTPPDREAWLKLRQQGIGASEASAVCGASRFASPYSVWLEKIDGRTEWGDESEMMQAGRRLEPVIAQWFQEQFPAASVTNPGDFTMVWANESCPMFATLDRLVDFNEGRAVLEMKCAWGPAGKLWETQIPLGYQIQLCHQMICTGLRVGYLAVLIDGYRFRWHRLDYNEKFAGALIRKLTRFWQSFVITREPPPVDFSKATTDALAAQWMPPQPTTVELPQEAMDWTARRAAIAAQTAALEREDKLLANQLRLAIGENEVGILPDGETCWTWKQNAKGSRTLRKAKVKKNVLTT